MFTTYYPTAFTFASSGYCREFHSANVCRAMFAKCQWSE
jgi:hypothetical protein